MIRENKIRFKGVYGIILIKKDANANGSFLMICGVIFNVNSPKGIIYLTLEKNFRSS